MVWVVKASGKMEKFNVNKVRRTARRAGASKELADTISRQVQQRVKNGMTTGEILNITLSLLRKDMPQVAAKYDLKGALLRLGPAGFTFEHLVSEVLKAHGYKTKVHTMIKGGTGVMHEIDVIASKSAKIPKDIEVPHMKTFQIECKYHASPGIFTGLKDVLYTYARFLDLQDGHKKGYCQRFDQAWLATNTKFSRDVIRYAVPNNIKLLGWDYPAGEALRDLIDEKRLYPITVLRNLDIDNQVKLAKANIVLLNTLIDMDMEKLNLKTGISVNKLKELRIEAENIIR